MTNLVTYSAVVEDMNGVAVAEGGQSVGDRDRGPASLGYSQEIEG